MLPVGVLGPFFDDQKKPRGMDLHDGLDWRFGVRQLVRLPISARPRREDR